MHITGMTISHRPPFTEPVEFEFDERVNVFVGPNASGKSVVLRALQSRTPIDSRFDFQLSDDWAQALRNETLVRSMRSGVNLPAERKEGADFVPWTYIPAGRINLPLSSDIGGMSNIQAESVSYVYIEDEIDDAMRGNRAIDLSHLLQDSLYAFDGRTVHKIYKTLADRMRMQRASPGDIRLYRSAEEAASQCAQAICSEILLEGVAADYIHQHSGTRDAPPLTNVHDRMAIPTTDASGTRIFMGDLSSGTQGTFLWIWFLALKISEFYKHRPYTIRNIESGWRSAPAILLIDELENNLHPSWQRRVIPALLAHFPGLQIFATTHSPFVVAGLKKGQVHVLKRDTHGVISYSHNEHDIIGWTTDEILRTFMGVDEPTDQLTIDRRERLLELRRKDPLTDEEEAEMAELRRQVNEDFLSSSTPLEAQRERYGDKMLEFLRSRQSELSQDGS